MGFTQSGTIKDALGFQVVLPSGTEFPGPSPFPSLGQPRMDQESLSLEQTWKWKCQSSPKIIQSPYRSYEPIVVHMGWRKRAAQASLGSLTCFEWTGDCTSFRKALSGPVPGARFNGIEGEVLGRAGVGPIEPARMGTNLSKGGGGKNWRDRSSTDGFSEPPPLQPD